MHCAGLGVEHAAGPGAAALESRDDWKACETGANPDTAHYRLALDTPERRQASAVLPGRILASREFFTALEAGLPDLAQLPTLIVWGDADIAFRPQERERLEATFPERKTVIVEGAGTYMESDAPEEFVAAIRGWHTT
ncbi:hypothetical protein QMK17_15145 [Rhodococcus sp. G-MC3]|uniref:hypothetical protein n=1 Tax=Rhodococcus sp. G-MC3 TaxID=3046209 RepID=UPI0024B95BA6|nr:hypothetical protein [Rhodococcus sp. G-MC3]MDJ0394659.1 hypothetical protein [Rhodococcus sp. G-MC3]